MRKLNLIAAFTAACITGGAWASTVVVSPTTLNGWAFNNTDNAGNIGLGTGTGDFVTGPATPPLGVGSAHLETPAGGGDQSVQLRNTSYNGTLLSSLTALSYSTDFSAWNGPGGQDTYLTLYINTTGVGATPGSYDDRIFFEPVYSNNASTLGDPFGVDPYPDQGPPTINTWQNWNLMQGMWYGDNEGGPGNDTFTLSQYLGLFPNATIVNAAPGLGGIRIASGFASPGDNFDDYVDDFTIGTSAGSTTFDFEPSAPVPLPKTVWGGVVLFAGLGLMKFRQRRANAA